MYQIIRRQYIFWSALERHSAMAVFKILFIRTRNTEEETPKNHAYNWQTGSGAYCYVCYSGEMVLILNATSSWKSKP